VGDEATIGQVQTAAVGVLVVAMMVSLGLQVHADELLAFVRRPRALLLAALANIVVLPCAAFALVSLLDLDAAVTTALMLCVAAPAGPAAALYANTARADLGFTALLTLALPTLGLITTPLTVALALGNDAGDPFALVGPMFKVLLIFQAAPLAVAMAVRAWRPRWADVAAPWATGSANAMLAVVATLLLVLKGHVLLTLGPRVWMALAIIAALCTVVGYIAGLPDRQTARAGALTGVSRNVTVALLLAAAFFPGPTVDATVLCFGALALVIPLALALRWRASGVSRPDPSSAPETQA